MSGETARRNKLTMTRQERISEYRRRQPLEELERKWLKARGRWSNQYWSLEFIDLVSREADELKRLIEQHNAREGGK